jgi:hypothetical protein
MNRRTQHWVVGGTIGAVALALGYGVLRKHHVFSSLASRGLTLPRGEYGGHEGHEEEHGKHKEHDEHARGEHGRKHKGHKRHEEEHDEH